MKVLISILFYTFFLTFIVLTVSLVSRIIDLPVIITDIFDLDHSRVENEFNNIWSHMLLLIIFQVASALVIILGLVLKNKKEEATRIDFDYSDPSVPILNPEDDKTTEKEEFNRESFIATVKQEILRSKTYEEIATNLIGTLSQELDAVQGIFYIREPADEGEDFLKVIAGFAYYKREDGALKFRFGEGLAGQAAKSQQMIVIKHIPEGYITIVSGLGESSPNRLLLIPVVTNHETLGVMEIASFTEFTEEKLSAAEDVVKWASRLLKDKYKKAEG